MRTGAYATAADLSASDFLSSGLTVPADAARLLSRASREIDKALVACVYDVDDATGHPTDADLITALRDATCAQACWWIETGDEAGVASNLDSLGAGSGPYINGRLSRLAPDAVEVLRQATDSDGTPLLTGPWWQ